MEKVAVVVALLLATGCAEQVPDTWQEWCEQLSTLDPEASDGWGGIFNSRPDEAALRSDFTSRYNELVLTAIVRHRFPTQDPDDPAIRELAQQKSIGVWSEGTTLHIADSFINRDPELGTDEWPAHVEWYREVLDHSAGPDELTDSQYCLSSAINAVFSSVVLHGANPEDAVEIQVEHSWAKAG